MPFRCSAQTLLFFAALALMPALSNEKALALYLERVIRIVVRFAPGGGTDMIARPPEEFDRYLGGEQERWRSDPKFADGFSCLEYLWIMGVAKGRPQCVNAAPFLKDLQEKTE